jgi:hypothetical protein
METGKDPETEITFPKRKKSENNEFLHLCQIHTVSTLLEIIDMEKRTDKQQGNPGDHFGALDLRMENEILKLTMQAESGAEFWCNENIPPEIENILLNRIRDTEAAFANAGLTTINELVGNPFIMPSYLLKASEFSDEISRIMQLLNTHGIYVYFRGTYPEKLIYDFITIELFQLETEDINLPGFIRTYVYEDFHPAHKITIQDVASGFLEHWLAKDMEYFDLSLTEVFVTNKGSIKTKYEVQRKIQAFFNYFIQISNASYYFSQCDFHWDESENMGTGHAEGYISYDASCDNGKTTHYEGAFKFYLTHEDNGWEIFYFILPGFQW